LIYDLSAVLIHKGTAANSGHYIAHIKDENTGQWWEFDDEVVTNLGRSPFSEEISCSASKSGKNDVDHSSLSEARVADSNGIGLNVKVSQSSLTETFSSSDAYMLMYHLKQNKIFSENGGMVSSDNHTKRDIGSVTAQDNDCLPSHFREEIQNFNASYLDACQQYDHKKEVELSHINERREEVRSVLAEAPVQPLEQQFFWIYSDWLRQWAENVTPRLVHMLYVLLAMNTPIVIFFFVTKLFPRLSLMHISCIIY
jgi:ubiquitin carboxyl-terminal hydrolase 48